MEIELTTEQKDKIKACWNEKQKTDTPATLQEMCEAAWPGENIDGRSLKGRLVKAFLSECEMKFKTSAKEKRELELTDEQREFIKNNLPPAMSPLEIAQTLFGNEDITPLHTEFKLVNDYLKTFTGKDTGIAVEPYKPPKGHMQVFARVSRYLPNQLNAEKLTKGQKFHLQALENLLVDVRFTQIINGFVLQDERELFERSIVRHLYDKAAAVTSEETDLYINLALCIVNQAQAIRRRNSLYNLFASAAESSDGMRASKSLSDQIANLTKEINDNENRQQKLISDLQGKRSERLKLDIQKSASMLSLFEFWRFQDTRNDLLKRAEERQQEIREEIKRINKMDETVANIFGISEDEILNGM